MSLQIISKELKSILSGQPSTQHENILEMLFRSEQGITPEAYHTASKDDKLEILVNLYFDIICRLDKSKIAELKYVTNVLNKCDERLNDEGIKVISDLYVESNGKVSVAEGIEAAKNYAMTQKIPQFVIRGLEFRSSRINPSNFEMKIELVPDTPHLFGTGSDNNANLRKLFTGINANLTISYDTNNVNIFQHPVDSPDDFFYIEVHHQQLEEGDSFSLNRIIMLSVLNVSADSITVKIQKQDDETELRIENSFTIGSSRSDDYYIQSQDVIAMRVYKNNSKWSLTNDHPQTLLMQSFHKSNDFNRNSKSISMYPSEMKRVMIAGHFFQFIHEE